MPNNGLSLLGVNLSGAEFGSGTHYGWNYIYPSHAEVDYYASKNLNVIRLPFLWERLQPTLNGPLDSAELGRIKDIVDYAATKGMTVVLDPHDYGGYGGNLIGSAAVPDSAFANFWGQLSAQFTGSSNVMFGLMNEPNQQSATTWLQSANAAIAAIRATGAGQEILVPGSYWDGGSSWTTSDNASVVGTGVIDPANNYAFEIHQYLDTWSSGTQASVVSTSIGVDRLTAVTAWAEQHGARLFLGEFGVSQDPTALTAMNNMLSFMSQHADVWQGATYWGAGPWWGDYMFSIEPSNGVDKPQMAVLDAYAPQPAGQTSPDPVVTPAPDPVVTPAPIPVVTPVLLPAVTAALTADTGASASDGVTSSAVLNGSGDAGAVVTFTVDGTVLTDTVTADGNGAWSKDFSNLADGQHTVAVSETNAAGTANASVAFTLDTTAPAPAIRTPAGRVSSAAQTITGTGEAGSTITLLDNGVALSLPQAVTVGQNGTWSAAITLSGAGTHSLTVTDTDAAGNAKTSGAVVLTYDHPPVFTSGGGGVTAIYNVAANARQVGAIQAADSDPNDSVTYALLDSKGNRVTTAAGLAINATSGVLSFVGNPTIGLHSVTVVATDTHGGKRRAESQGQCRICESYGRDPQHPAGGADLRLQPFQTSGVVQNFRVADITASGVTAPHSVLSLAHTMFNGVTAGASGSGVTALIASHSRQVGQDTMIRTDRGQLIDLVGVNRQALLAHSSDIAFT